MYTVYELINNQNHKKYFGVTSMKNPEDRWKEYYRHNESLHKDILSIGLDGFTKIIIKQIKDKEEALTLESQLIEKYNTINPELGYNILSKKGFKTNSNYISNLSNRTKGKNNPMYGKSWTENQMLKSGSSFKGHKHTDETKKKMSIAHKGKSFSEEHKQKLSKSLKGRTFSEETIKKMSDAAKNREITDEFRHKCSIRNSNSVWVNKDGKSSYIQKEKIQEYLDNGWIRGREKLKKHKDNTNYSKAASNRVWLHKDNIKTHCNKNDINKIITLLQNGWSLGIK